MSAKTPEEKYRSGWYEIFADPDNRVVDEKLVNNHAVCMNCYRLMRDVVEVPENIRRSHVKSVPDEISFARPDTTEKRAPGELYCSCGSDGLAQYYREDRRLGLPDIINLTRFATWTMRILGYDVDYVEAVGEAERLKSEDELGDDTIVLEAVEEALQE